MNETEFDTLLNDSQGTLVDPVDPEKFDIERYIDYEQALLQSNRDFWQKDKGIAVYRRFRVPAVFSDGCRDMKQSLALQLGALTKSMEYKADLANFLEPWYGIGVTAGAFGIEYKWEPGNAPAIAAPYSSVEEALAQDIVAIEKTPIGGHILNMIDYFLEKTKGKIPISLTDTQSALNAASFLIESNSFYMELFDNPEGMQKLLSIITDFTIEFSQKQKELIGDALVWPGHGFPGSRVFNGLGMSGDVAIMISDNQYLTYEAPNAGRAGELFGGAVFHSCGNWSAKIDAVKQIPNLLMVDAAFSKQTDPDPNPPQPFAEAFAGSGICLNARIVGNPETVLNKVNILRQPGIKLIITTYCQTPEEQEQIYNSIKNI
ncbi:hypothetical protein GF407_16400 [candidate division KSB1 bacterium]|nr:hypothetical protein [candidate division KSB1 bacterium]